MLTDVLSAFHILTVQLLATLVLRLLYHLQPYPRSQITDNSDDLYATTPVLGHKVRAWRGMLAWAGASFCHGASLVLLMQAISLTPSIAVLAMISVIRPVV